MKKILLITVVLSLINTYLFSRDIYVAKNGNDNNVGTQDQPYLTVAKASQIAIAGDVVNIREGEYQETLTPSNNGSAGNSIVFQSFLGEKVVITTIDPLSGWTSDGGNNIPLQNFTNGVYILKVGSRNIKIIKAN